MSLANPWKCHHCGKQKGVRVEIRDDKSGRWKVIYLICPRCGEHLEGSRLKTAEDAVLNPDPIMSLPPV
jgi:hypothetical protein